MNTRNQLFAAMAAALTLFLAIPGSATADVTEAQIAAAKTPADHEAIAKAYDAEAAAAEAKAKAHEGWPGHTGRAVRPRPVRRPWSGTAID